MRDILQFAGIDLQAREKLYVQTPTGIEEIDASAPAQIQTVVIKHNGQIFRYRVTMDRMH